METFGLDVALLVGVPLYVALLLEIIVPDSTLPNAAVLEAITFDNVLLDGALVVVELLEDAELKSEVLDDDKLEIV